MGKGALRPFFKGHSLKKEKEHEKKEVDKMLLHFVTLPTYCLILRFLSSTGRADYSMHILYRNRRDGILFPVFHPVSDI